jgi:hypothetical protein
LFWLLSLTLLRRLIVGAVPAFGGVSENIEGYSGCVKFQVLFQRMGKSQPNL